MRSLLAATLSLLATLVPRGSADQIAHTRRPQVLEHNIDESYTRFTTPCLAPGACSGGDDYLEFQVQLDTEDSPSDSLGFTLNGQKLDLQFTGHFPKVSIGSVTAHGGFDRNHTVDYIAWSSTSAGPDDAVRQIVRLHPHRIDSVANTNPGFTLIADRFQKPYLQTLLVADRESYQMRKVIDRGVVKPGFASADPMDFPDEKDFDFEDELDRLYLLEAQAENLQEQIVAKKHAIGQYLKDERAHVPLRALLEECDGLLCAAHVIAQRLCDKMGVVAEPSLSYARKHNPGLQHAFGSPNPQQTSRNCTKSQTPIPLNEKHGNGTAQSFNVPITVTKNSSSTSYHLIDPTLSPNPLLRALTILASLLGLIAFFRFLRRRCMSMRKRVERAADREERRNARAYRKAARRAAMRRRWDNLVDAVSCFRAGARDEAPQDYEEKRALILQDAFLEQLEAGDLEVAEKGEVMEAEIRELRHAQEIVASLVRVDEHRYDLRGPPVLLPVNDPPPPLVPLPFTPETRSRASTGTLPSYTSESLPDYSSRPPTLADHTITTTTTGSSSGSTTSDSLVDGFPGYTPTSLTSASDEGRAQTPSSTFGSTSSAAAGTRYTPTSSILDVSPRVSEETLQTRRSDGTSVA